MSTVSQVLAATVVGGTLTAISQNNFIEQSFLNVGAGTVLTLTPLSAITTSILETYSFFIYNQSASGAVVDAFVEVSADGTHWFRDVEGVNITSGTVNVLVPQRFMKYTRLSYRSATTLVASTIDVIFNAQGS